MDALRPNPDVPYFAAEWDGTMRCRDCFGLWPDFCSCPDRDDEVAARDERNDRED